VSTLVTKLQTDIPQLYIEYLGCDLAQILNKLTISSKPTLVIEMELNIPALGIKELLTNLIITKLALAADSTIYITSKIKRACTPNSKNKISNIKNIISIASGKGGVGKSTVAVNLALALVACGARVGLLDADLYGPSQPQMLGIDSKIATNANKEFIPIVKYGLTCISIGSMLDTNSSPAMWRGPMISSAFQQLLFQTSWGELDYLIVDLPPGTGDIQLTMSQKTPITTSLIVTTPQDVALIDARKAIQMFERLEVSILGVIENMSFFQCPNCNSSHLIFGSEGASKLAAEFSSKILAQLPIFLDVRLQSDIGVPIVVAEPEHTCSALFMRLAYLVAVGITRLPKDRALATTLVTDK